MSSILYFGLRDTTRTISSGANLSPPPPVHDPIMNNSNYSGASFFTNSQYGAPPQNPQPSASTNANTPGGLGSSQFATPNSERVQRFNSWHTKQGIATPPDYTNYASQPDPFSTVPKTPLQPSSASPYLQKVVGLPSGRPADSLVRSVFDARRALRLREDSANSL